MKLTINQSDAELLHEQVAGAIRRAIAEGEAKPGEQLPPSKDLAKVLGVNSNTVLRALRTLRDEGILEFRRGRGVSVVGAPDRASFLEQVRELVIQSRQLGLSRKELVQLVGSYGL